MERGAMAVPKNSRRLPHSKPLIMQEKSTMGKKEEHVRTALFNSGPPDNAVFMSANVKVVRYDALDVA